MNTTIIITSIAVSLICIFAIIYILYRKNKIKKNRQDWFLNIGAASGCGIKEFDLWRSAAIGMDKSKKQLFYLKEPYRENEPVVVDLADVARCKSESITASSGQYTSIDKTGLRLFYKDNKKPALMLDFYNSDVSFQIVNELELVKKWESKINSII